jgi:hypothetical protein
LLLAQTGEGYTACLLAFVNKHVETENKLFEWAAETRLNKRELIKRFFQPKMKVASSVTEKQNEAV